jgi:hypothetical protein
MKKLAMILVTLMILAGSANGGTIYIWTDEKRCQTFQRRAAPERYRELRNRRGKHIQAGRGTA